MLCCVVYSIMMRWWWDNVVVLHQGRGIAGGGVYRHGGVCSCGRCVVEITPMWNGYISGATL
jgi:hypothetical protein